ncbi:MAG TPA: hypothetical protein VLU41_14950, partial [Ideonella sp.]|nr:hypothetical protein [Ideonella sp.]
GLMPCRSALRCTRVDFAALFALATAPSNSLRAPEIGPAGHHLPRRSERASRGRSSRRVVALHERSLQPTLFRREKERSYAAAGAARRCRFLRRRQFSSDWGTARSAARELTRGS